MDKRTSLQASASGPTRCASLACQTTLPFGPVVVPASLTAAQGDEAELMTLATCGPSGAGLSRSAALRSSLVSRLHTVLGSTGRRVIWSGWDTPSRRVVPALRGLAHQDDDGFSLLPCATATANQCAPSMRKWPSCRLLQDWLPAHGVTFEEWQRMAMGLPPEWDACAPTETRSTLESRRSSSDRR